MTDSASEGNKEIVRRFIAETDRDGSPPAHLVTDDFAAHFPGAPNLSFDSYRSMTEGVYVALTDLRHNLHDLIAEGDRVVYRSTNGGIHTGEMMGQPGTGRRVTVSSLAEFRLVGGKVAEVWVEMDTLGLLQQLGGEA